MSTGLITPIIVLTCITSWSLETITNTTESYINSTESDTTSRLLYGSINSFECLRLYMVYQRRVYTSDICQSTRILSTFIMWYTKAICAPRIFGLVTRRYWVVFSQRNFYGARLIIRQGQCVTNLHQYGLWTVGSILKCIRLDDMNSPLYCYIPRQPTWPYDQFPLPGTPQNPNDPLQPINIQDGNGPDYQLINFNTNVSQPGNNYMNMIV
ncbi:unnamed protein product [Schistosoma turkestanicum]|nr:unnamed protein product [Schistosoma turkestanicum]